jgi:hypothetical protein
MDVFTNVIANGTATSRMPDTRVGTEKVTGALCAKRLKGRSAEDACQLLGDP